MLADINCHHVSARAAVSSVKHFQHPAHVDVAQSHDFDRQMFSISVALQRLCIFSVLCLTLIFPVTICDNSSCLSEYWCVSTDNADPCSIYSMQTGAVGQLCPCYDYQHNFTVCLNNVSTH